MSFWASEDDEKSFYHHHTGSVTDDDLDAISNSNDSNDRYLAAAAVEEQIARKKAEYAFEMSKNSQSKSQLEKSQIENRRKQVITEYESKCIYNDCQISKTKDRQLFTFMMIIYFTMNSMMMTKTWTLTMIIKQ